jgi:hypothetical protein
MTPEEAFSYIVEEYESDPKKYQSMAKQAERETRQSKELVSCVGAVCLALLMRMKS